MKYNKMIIIVICIVMGFATFSNFANGSETIKVYLNDKLIEFDIEPELVAGRTMVPLRGIFEALDMVVTWDDSTSTVTALKKDLNIKIAIGSDRPKVNGKEILIDAKAYIVDGSTMVPLRFIAESTGATVDWKASDMSVRIASEVISESELDIVQMTDRLYKIVDTGVVNSFSNTATISEPEAGQAYYGQDSNYMGYQASYKDNEDGTIDDLVTELMWQKTMVEKMTYDEAVTYANESKLGGYDDWRLPTIKELFSLILYTGSSGGERAKELFIDTQYFDQPIGDTSIGEREIDAQVWSSTKYVSTTMNGDATIFGVNFIDGRIKGYGLVKPRTNLDNKGYFRLVRGNKTYGENMFIDNGDGTISDLATGLMWQQMDDGIKRNWQETLAYSEGLTLAGHTDWRTPDIKELQSIVDYTRSPNTTNSPAIDPMFVLTEMKDPSGAKNFGFYWSGTTHQDGKNPSSSASYVAFGEAQGQMNGRLMDVHGAGSVRSDPKSGNLSDYPSYFGPQGDVRYVYNYVLSVRTISE